MTPIFSRKSAYMGCRFYKVSDSTGNYEIEERYELGDYERSIMNPCVDIDREILAMIGFVRRSYSQGAIPGETIEAFNVWRLAQHNTAIAKMDAQPDRYDLAADDPIRIPPPVVRGAMWTPEAGFVATA